MSLFQWHSLNIYHFSKWFLTFHMIYLLFWLCKFYKTNVLQLFLYVLKETSYFYYLKKVKIGYSKESIKTINTNGYLDLIEKNSFVKAGLGLFLSTIYICSWNIKLATSNAMYLLFAKKKNHRHFIRSCGITNRVLLNLVKLKLRKQYPHQ